MDRGNIQWVVEIFTIVFPRQSAWGLDLCQSTIHSVESGYISHSQTNFIRLKADDRGGWRTSEDFLTTGLQNRKRNLIIYLNGSLRAPKGTLHIMARLYVMMREVTD
eukprot:580803-Amorphochlora_amoeboformis.AAC.1